MSHGGGGGAAQPSCTTMPLGKKVRRALRAAIGMQKKKKPKDKPKKKKNKLTKDAAAGGSGSSSTELISSFSFSNEAAVARKKESVVRVVLSSGVVEVYPGVVLACTVIRKHPPGLCLAHPDVFRNPHGAVVRPLEPLFPGQKFLLIPWSTVDKLKQKIPESSIGAFADDAGSEEEEASSSSSSSTGTGTDQAAAAADDDEAAAACSARAYFMARDRWSECRFRKLVAQGLAVEPSTDDDDQPEMERKDKQTKKQKAGKKKKRSRGVKAAGNKKRREQRRPAAPPAGLLRAFATVRTRTWEPSLPPVVEEENAAVSPLDHHPSETEEASSTDVMIMTHEQYVS